MLLAKFDVIEVTSAENGEDAVRLVQNDMSKYVMILMDNVMPVMVRKHEF